MSLRAFSRAAIPALWSSSTRSVSADTLLFTKLSSAATCSNFASVVSDAQRDCTILPSGNRAGGGGGGYCGKFCIKKWGGDTPDFNYSNPISAVQLFRCLV